MTTEEIRELAAIMDEFDLSRVEISADGAILEKRQTACAENAKAENIVAASNKDLITSEAASKTGNDKSSGEVKTQQDGIIITAPLVGIFYGAASPQEPPLVKVGDRIETGDTVCIIEAMKMMNEVTSDRAGTVAEIFAQEGKLVEFGQPLFRLEA